MVLVPVGVVLVLQPSVPAVVVLELVARLLVGDPAVVAVELDYALVGGPTAVAVELDYTTVDPIVVVVVHVVVWRLGLCIAVDSRDLLQRHHNATIEAE